MTAKWQTDRCTTGVCRSGGYWTGPCARPRWHRGNHRQHRMTVADKQAVAIVRGVVAMFTFGAWQ